MKTCTPTGKTLVKLHHIPRYDEHEIAATITVDESAAFDSISLETLLEKMECNKIHEDTLTWFKDYLRQGPITLH